VAKICKCYLLLRANVYIMYWSRSRCAMGLDHNHLPTHADSYNLFTCTCAGGCGSEFVKLVSCCVCQWMQSSKLYVLMQSLWCIFLTQTIRLLTYVAARARRVSILIESGFGICKALKSLIKRIVALPHGVNTEIGATSTQHPRMSFVSWLVEQ